QSRRPARAPPAWRAATHRRQGGSRAGAIPGDAAPRPRLRGRIAEEGVDRRLPRGRGREPGRSIPAPDVFAVVLAKVRAIVAKVPSRGTSSGMWEGLRIVALQKLAAGRSAHDSRSEAVPYALHF